MNDRYQNIKSVFKTEPYYQKCISQTIADFPLLDCPQEYKEAICALSGGQDLAGYLSEPLESLSNRTITQVLEAKDFDAIEQYIFECVALDMTGPGSF